jgi:hypothetical protein
MRYPRERFEIVSAIVIQRVDNAPKHGRDIVGGIVVVSAKPNDVGKITAKSMGYRSVRPESILSHSSILPVRRKARYQEHLT